MGYLLYGSRYNWWLSSPSASNTTNFCNVNNNGNANNNDARNGNGVAPDFMLGIIQRDIHAIQVLERAHKPHKRISDNTKYG